MNHMIRYRLSGIVVVLLLPLVLGGCNQYGCAAFCGLFTYLPCTEQGLGPLCVFLFVACFALGGCWLLPAEYCAEDPEECTAMYTYYQEETAQLCEAYPEECQQTFNTWVEALDEEAEE